MRCPISGHIKPYFEGKNAMKKLKRAVAVGCLIAGVIASQSVLRAEETNTPHTPFSVQTSLTGVGISGVYRFNGPVEDGPYMGLSVALQSITGINHDGSQSKVGGWLGMRKLIDNGTYLVYGGEAFSSSGSNLNGSHIESALEGGPFVGVHKYLTSHIYVTAYTNPVYFSQVQLSGDSDDNIKKFQFFTGGIGLGYQF